MGGGRFGQIRSQEGAEPAVGPQSLGFFYLFVCDHGIKKIEDHCCKHQYINFTDTKLVLSWVDFLYFALQHRNIHVFVQQINVHWRRQQEKCSC